MGIKPAFTCAVPRGYVGLDADAPEPLRDDACITAAEARLDSLLAPAARRV